MNTVDNKISKDNNPSHWNKIYQESNDASLGWYEQRPEPSIELFRKVDLSKDDKILIVGAGKSTFVDWLVEEGFTDIIANDISPESSQKLDGRIKEKGGKIYSLVDDLCAPKNLLKLKDIKLWHDRAVLHFLIEEKDQQTYFDLINNLISPGGYVIIAEFSKEGINACSGLPVVKYSVEMITKGLGKDFYLIDSFNYMHKSPVGASRPYIYTLFRRHSG